MKNTEKKEKKISNLSFVAKKRIEQVLFKAEVLIFKKSSLFSGVYNIKTFSKKK